MGDSWTNRSSQSDKWIVYISTYAFGRQIHPKQGSTFPWDWKLLDLGIASAKTCLNDSFMNQIESIRAVESISQK